MNTNAVATFCLLLSAAVFAANPDFSMVGFATCEGSPGQNLTGGTTGGKGGATVTATNAADFLKYIADPAPLTILVSGTIALPATPKMYEVKSNKSIIGIGSTASITSAGLNIGPMEATNAVTSPPADATNNIIIRNITFTGGGDDLINVQMYSHHVWIDHCDFSKSADGAVDIKRGSDWITVSWNTFHDHNKTCLLGHDDGNGTQDEGHLHVTYHHNFFNATRQRHPRVRFGVCHVYNNYYFNLGDYGIGAGDGAKIYSENNYFEGVEDCTQYYGNGSLKDVGSFAVGAETFETSPAGVTWVPSDFYKHSPDAAQDVKSIVTQYAGVGKIDSSPVLYQLQKIITRKEITGSAEYYTIQGQKMTPDVSAMFRNTLDNRCIVEKTPVGRYQVHILSK